MWGIALGVWGSCCSSILVVLGGSWSWSAVTLGEEGLRWVSVAEMPFVDAVLLGSLLAPCPEHPKWCDHPSLQGMDAQVWLSPLAVPPPHCCQVSFWDCFLFSASWCLAAHAARAWKQWGLGTLFLHLPCTKRNVKQLSDQSELHKGALFSVIFLPDFRAAEECFLLFGAGYCGSVHTTSKGVCQGSW